MPAGAAGAAGAGGASSRASSAGATAAAVAAPVTLCGVAGEIMLPALGSARSTGLALAPPAEV